MPVVPVMRQPVGGHTQKQIMCVLVVLYVANLAHENRRLLFQIPGYNLVTTLSQPCHNLVTTLSQPCHNLAIICAWDIHASLISKS